MLPQHVIDVVLSGSLGTNSRAPFDLEELLQSHDHDLQLAQASPDVHAVVDGEVLAKVPLTGVRADQLTFIYGFYAPVFTEHGEDEEYLQRPVPAALTGIVAAMLADEALRFALMAPDLDITIFERVRASALAELAARDDLAHQILEFRLVDRRAEFETHRARSLLRRARATAWLHSKGVSAPVVDGKVQPASVPVGFERETLALAVAFSDVVRFDVDALAKQLGIEIPASHRHLDMIDELEVAKDRVLRPLFDDIELAHRDVHAWVMAGANRDQRHARVCRATNRVLADANEALLDAQRGAPAPTDDFTTAFWLLANDPGNEDELRRVFGELSNSQRSILRVAWSRHALVSNASRRAPA